LTLDDRNVLDEDEGDVLVNVNIQDQERYDKNLQNKKLKPNYDPYGDDESTVLSKYDEEIHGAKKESFVIGDRGRVNRKDTIKEKFKEIANKKIESLSGLIPQLATEYYTQEEMNVKFKKRNTKGRKIRKKVKMLKPDDLLSDPLPTSTAEDEEKFLYGESASNGITRKTKEALSDDEGPAGDLSNFKVEDEDQDDSDLQKALDKARKIQQSEKMLKDLPLPDETPSQEDVDMKTSSRNFITLNSTSEFCRALGEIPTYGMAGNREDEADDMMDYERSAMEEQLAEEARRRSAWAEVNMETTPINLENLNNPQPILEDEPSVNKGTAGALEFVIQKGYLDSGQDRKTRIKGNVGKYAARNYTIEDKNYDDDKAARRDRFSGPTQDFNEKKHYKPEVKLDYIDDSGKLLNQKEAFRYLSHKFHGKGSGKNKIEKRMNKNMQGHRVKEMSSTDTPLGTLDKLQERQKETQAPYVVLTGSKQSTTSLGSISKPK